MWIDAGISVRNSDPERLEKAILHAKEAGCTVARDGLLGGRRYESFPMIDDWNGWVKQSLAALKVAVPIFEKHKFTLATENHKDWTLEQYLNIFREYSREYFGATLDFGNNIAMLDEPMGMEEAVVPFIKATHVKDMGVMPYEDGFLLRKFLSGPDAWTYHTWFRYSGKPIHPCIFPWKRSPAIR